MNNSWNPYKGVAWNYTPGMKNILRGMNYSSQNIFKVKNYKFDKEKNSPMYISQLITVLITYSVKFKNTTYYLQYYKHLSKTNPTSPQYPSAALSPFVSLKPSRSHSHNPSLGSYLLFCNSLPWFWIYQNRITYIKWITPNSKKYLFE